MTDLIRLAERVEALAGPDREVDLEIYRAIYPFPCVALSERAQDAFDLEKAPKYTSSLDAAMSLVPELLREHAFLQTSTPAKAGFEKDGTFTYFEAATPALALTAAAIRSLAAQRGQG
jgi:hypothetical protein